MIDQFVDKIFVINLDHRLDRWSSISSQLINLNIHNYERFSGHLYRSEIVSNYVCGNIGCMISHFMINEISKRHGYKRILVLEDDCTFLEESYCVYNFQNAFDYLNVLGFDMFYLGATFHANGITHINNYIDKINECSATHAVVMDVDAIYDIFRRRYNNIAELIQYCIDHHTDTSSFTIDGTYGSFNLRRFTTNPILAIQRPSHSDITGNFSATDQYNMWKSSKMSSIKND